MRQPPEQFPEAERAVLEEIRRENALAIEFVFGPGVLREGDHNSALESWWNCTSKAELQWHQLD